MDLTQIQTFVAVIEERGVSSAARRLGIAKSVCSRRLSELEADLGAQLVRRTTRTVTPTDLGMDYFDQCRDILRRIEEANALVSEATTTIAGPLRITAPLAFTTPPFQPILESFIQKFPRVRFDLHLSDAREDLVASGFDAGIRVGELPDSALISKKIGETRLLVCASPNYLKSHGTPAHPDDLGDHQCLMYTNLSSGSIWTFEKSGTKYRKRLNAHVKSNNDEFLCALAEADHGVVCLPDFVTRAGVDAGRLVPLFCDYESTRHGIYVVFPKRRHLSATVRAFVDHVTAYLSTSFQ